MKNLEVGKTYQFNDAVAVIVELADDEVTWREEHAKSSFNHRVPRWFFEKFATFTLHEGDGKEAS